MSSKTAFAMRLEMRRQLHLSHKVKQAAEQRFIDSLPPGIWDKLWQDLYDARDDDKLTLEILSNFKAGLNKEE